VGAQRRAGEEAVFTLVGLAAGTFRFEAGGEAEAPAEGALSTEQVLAEAARIRQLIPSPDTAVVLVPDPPGGDADVSVSREEWHLLALAGGARTAADLMERTGWTQVTLGKALTRLVADGLVQLGGETAAAKPAVEVLFAEEPEPVEVPAPEPVEVPAPAPRPRPRPPEHVDRVQVARELAALGLEDEQGAPTRPRPAARANADAIEEQPKALTRDHEITKDVLLRLIDGVKEA
jgi:hypothetical protein